MKIKYGQLTTRNQIFLTLCFLLFFQLNVSGQETKADDQAKKWILSGNFGYINYKYTPDYEYDDEYNGKKVIFKPRIGYFVSKNFCLGLGLGIEHYEDYPEQLYPYSHDEGSHYETRYVNSRVLSSLLFLRYQNKLLGKTDFYVDGEIGLAYQLAFDYGKVSTDIISNIGGGVLFHINKSISLQTEIISMKYREEHKKTEDKPFTTLNLEYIFSNPNIGLVFYF